MRQLQLRSQMEEDHPILPGLEEELREKIVDLMAMAIEEIYQVEMEGRDE